MPEYGSREFSYTLIRLDWANMAKPCKTVLSSSLTMPRTTASWPTRQCKPQSSRVWQFSALKWGAVSQTAWSCLYGSHWPHLNSVQLLAPLRNSSKSSNKGRSSSTINTLGCGSQWHIGWRNCLKMLNCPTVELLLYIRWSVGDMT